MNPNTVMANGPLVVQKNIISYADNVLSLSKKVYVVYVAPSTEFHYVDSRFEST